MKKQSSFSKRPEGTLYLVPTPIGNLQDITLRALETLKSVDWIASEDTRNTQKLLNHFEIATKQISFHEHNTQARIPELIGYLEAGQSIAQVSDAGMPSISDPGAELVAAAVEKGLAVVPLPGANAATTALIASGLAPQPFTFIGFLPRKASAMKVVLEQFKDVPSTLMFYESPHRLAKTLAVLAEVYGPREAVLARELTKRFEEFSRGTLDELAEDAIENARGEYVVLVGPPSADSEAEVPPTEVLLQQVNALIAEGEKPNAALKMVASKYGLKKQALYKQFHGIEE